MAHPPLCGQLAALHRLDFRPQKGEGTVEIGLVTGLPTAAVEQGPALGRQQRHQIFGNDRRCRNGPGHGPVEAATAITAAAGALNPLAAQRHPVAQAKGRRH